jgi:hypothetical protein
MNGYGPTEACVFCLTREVTVEDNRPSKLGRAVSSRSWIVDIQDVNRLVPVGCVGELVVEGHSLARGYLHDSQKTDAAFVPSPPWASRLKDSAPRIYKTGDLVRYEQDGSLTYLGRKDAQVKVNGQRLELGEVEHHLLAHESTKDVVAVLLNEGLFGNKLVAVLSLHALADGEQMALIDNSSKTLALSLLSSLQESVSQKLPGYMVPTVWVPLKQLPLNSSGKIDRAKIASFLQSADEEMYQRVSALSADNEQTEPATAMEREIQRIVGGALGVPPATVSLARSFAAQGGDSIMAMQISASCRQQGLELAVKDILRSKTLSDLALAMSRSAPDASPTGDASKEPFRLLLGQEVILRSSKGLSHPVNESIVLEFPGPILPSRVERALRTVIGTHAMLRARVHRSSTGWVQTITEDVDQSFRFTHRRVQTVQDMHQHMVSEQDAIHPETGPISIAGLFDIPGGKQYLYLAAHALFVDEASWRVIADDLESVIFKETEPSKPPGFQAFVRQQTEESLDTSATALAPSIYTYWGVQDRETATDAADVKSLEFSLPPDVSTGVVRGENGLHADPRDIFIALLLHSYKGVFTDREPPVVHCYEVGDRDNTYARTVGRFSRFTPLKLSLSNVDDMVNTMIVVKDQRRQATHHSVKQWPMEVVFHLDLENQRQGLLKVIPMGKEVSTVHPNAVRPALLEVFVRAAAHGVQVQFEFSGQMQSSSQRSLAWLKGYEQALTTAAIVLPALPFTPTPSDYPLLSLSYDDLERLTTARLPALGVASASDVEDMYPCAPMQVAMLLSQTKAPETYQVFFTFAVRDPARSNGLDVDVDRLARSWKQVVQRHGILRTLFADNISRDDVFDLVVLKNAQPDIEILHAPTDDEGMEMLARLEPPRYHEGGLQHRVKMCVSQSGKVFFKLSINHTIVDAAATTLILRDLALAYEGHLPAGSGPSYANFVRYIQQHPIKRSLEYWKSSLAGLEGCHFPMETARRSVERTTRTTRTLEVDLQITSDRLRVFCRSVGVTLPSLFQAVWALVLQSYTSSDDVCFGFISSGRDIAVDDAEETVGPFISMLVRRMKIAARESVSSFLTGVQLTYAASLEHQHCPLGDIQHALGISQTALFNSIMSVQREGATDSGTEALRYERVGAQDPTEVSLPTNTSVQG